MKLALDLQSCQTDSRDRGIGRYSLSLAEAMARQIGDDDMAVLLDAADATRLADARRALRLRGIDARSHVYAYPTQPHFTDAVPALKSSAEMLKSRLVESVGPDVLLVSSLFEFGGAYSSSYDLEVLEGIPKAVIVYDLIPSIFPEHYLPDGHHVARWYRQRLETLQGFDLYLAISEATKADLVDQLGIDPEKITVIGAGLDDSFRRTELASDPPAKDLRELGITKPYVLVVGNADWRKNCVGALEAFARLPRHIIESHQLVFTRVGDDVVTAMNGRLRHVRNAVVVLGSVGESTLRDLYERCRVFFFPSFYEGFGLPVIEAMACGAAVLCSDKGSLPEVVSTPAALFDPTDVNQASELLRSALEDDEFRAQLLAGAREHALSFDWNSCAELTLSALRDLSCRYPAPSSPRPDWDPNETDIRVLATAVYEGGSSADARLESGLLAISRRGSRRILIDVTEVVRLDARSGIQRVVRNYCAELLAAQADGMDGIRVEPIQWSEQGIRYARSYCRRNLSIEVEGDDDLVTIEDNDVVFMVDSSWWSPDRFDLFHQSVQQAGGEVVWMVYDLVPVLTPEFCDPGMPPVFRAWLDHVSTTADGCICISRTTELELQRYFDETSEHGQRLPWTRFVHLGSDLDAKRSTPASPEVIALAEALATSGYCVALSTVEPRKDYPTILSAFEQLWERGHKLSLVIVGKKGWQVDSLEARIKSHPEFGRHLFWLENASDGDVSLLLRRAKALVQASLAEGYGLAVAEAGSLGVPLVLSDLPVFREIAADQAEYFATEDVAMLRDILLSNLESGSWLRPERLEVDTWQESSARLLKVLGF